MGEGIQAHPSELPIGEILSIQDAFISGSSVDVLKLAFTPRETLFCSEKEPLASNIKIGKTLNAGTIELIELKEKLEKLPRHEKR